MQRQARVPEPRRGSGWRTRLLSHDIIVAETHGRLLGFMSLAERGYILVPKLHLETRPGLGSGASTHRHASTLKSGGATGSHSWAEE